MRLRYNLLLGCLTCLILAGCLTDTHSGHGGVPRLARLTLEVRIGADGRLYKPSGALASSRFATLSLERAIVTLTSGKLVMRDTITPEGSRLSKEPAYLSPSPAYAQSLLLRYERKPDRAWTAMVQVFDGQDSIRYAGSLTLNDMDAYEYLNGSLPVDPRYAVYETRLRLPAKIEADGVPGSGRGLRALYFDRLELIVNGNLVMERLPGISPTGVPDQRTLFADTALLYGSEGKRFFRPSDVYADPPFALSYDYVSLSANRFEVAT